MNRNNDGGTAKTVLVVGGEGFIGGHIVRSLRRAKAEVVIGGRKKSGTGTGRRLIDLNQIYNPAQWDDHLEGIDVVVNAVGILRERPGESYDRVHHLAPAALAAASKRRNIRLIHVSIMGVESPAASRFVSTKRAGELAVQASAADWVIVRPSLVDGAEGFGSGWFRRLARWPVHFTPANAKGRFAPIAARDVGDAITAIALDKFLLHGDEDRLLELGGNRVMTVVEYLAALDPSREAKRLFPVPVWLARPVSHICDLFHLTPFSYGHYELLQHRNYSEHNRLEEILGRPALSIDSAAGGAWLDSLLSETRGSKCVSRHV